MEETKKSVQDVRPKRVNYRLWGRYNFINIWKNIGACSVEGEII